MAILCLGLALFLGIHLVPALPPARLRLIRAFGEQRYKLIFSVVSALGLILIVLGYARAPLQARLFNPVGWAHQIAPAAMTLSFILLAAANMKTSLRLWLRHPMLLAVGIWSALHFLSNGQARASLLFGAFFVYVLLDLTSAVLRGSAKSFKPSASQDLIAVVAGSLFALLVMTFHRHAFGVQVVGWGL